MKLRFQQSEHNPNTPWNWHSMWHINWWFGGSRLWTPKKTPLWQPSSQPLDPDGRFAQRWRPPDRPKTTPSRSKVFRMCSRFTARCLGDPSPKNVLHTLMLTLGSCFRESHGYRAGNAFSDLGIFKHLQTTDSRDVRKWKLNLTFALDHHLPLQKVVFHCHVISSRSVCRFPLLC